MDLRDILKDSKQFGDNMVITLANGQAYNLGMLRTLTTEQQNALSTKEAALVAKEAELTKKFDELKAAQATTAQTYADAQKQLDEIKSLRATPGATGSQPDPLSALENDNILGPFVKYTKALESQVKAAEKKSEDITKALQAMSQSYLNDRLTDTYARVVPQDKRDKITVEALITQGLQKGYKTLGGYVDIERAYADIAAPDNLEAAKKAADEAGYKRAMEEMQSKGIIIQAPTGGPTGQVGVPFASTREASPFKSLDEAINAAAKDVNIWREWNGQPSA